MMSMAQPNNPLIFIKAFCVIAVTVIVLYSPCRAEQLDISITEEMSAIDPRKAEEERIVESSFVIATHRQNYFLLVNYENNPNAKAYKNTGEDPPKNYEVKFQISFKVLTWKRMFGNNGDLFVAYTQRSYWQLYDRALSSPFRETNYEPEAFVSFETDFDVVGLKNRFFLVGFNHQSNGQGEQLSRSWNRIYASFVAERGKLAIILKPWYRIPENEEDDQNPDIEKYMGYGELVAAYRFKEHVFSLMLRNNLRLNENKGSAEIGWSFPITKKVRGYVQYFNGYGENLIDYDNTANRIGFGLMLNDWI